ncbi:uncharacterized protein LOC128502286 [Spea bombifrons]|uniref:uncharacterized protein LOC128502286 n=1 Tax=Spea bombifrons TaxID=233779 RepID=UPI00234B00E9|nr:uncharacterized protein LOC128502286 [Spea bombifrons]
MAKRRREKEAPPAELDLTPFSLHLLKRAQLQQHCKRLGLGGRGKNTDLIQRLRDHIKQTLPADPASPVAPSPEEPDESAKEPAERPGWCVVHGLRLTTARWVQLTLRCGRVCVPHGGSYVPLHLIPSSSPTPPDLQDNLICGECEERNQKKELRCQQKSNSQDKNNPHNGQVGNSDMKSTSRSRNKSGRFQPQEDPEYARRVDELLGKLATGQVDSEKVLQPVCPAVIHSPFGKQEVSPLSISRVPGPPLH